MARKLRDPMLRTLPDAHRLAAVPHAAADAAAPADHGPLKEPQRPRPAAAGRATKQAPRTAVRKLLQAKADFDLDIAQANRGPRRSGCNSAGRPQSRDADARQIVL